MALTVTIPNETDLQSKLAEHRAVGFNIRLVSDQLGGTDYEVDITGTSSEGGFAPSILHSNLGDYSSGTSITDLVIPSTTKVLDFQIMIDQRKSLEDEHDDVIYRFNASGMSELGEGTANIPFADNFDATGGYDRDSLTYGPAIVYVDAKNVGLTTDDGITLSSMLEANEVISGSVRGIIGKVRVKEGFGVKFAMQQLVLAQLKWAWALKNDPVRDENILLLGGTEAGERMDLIPADPGFMPEHHVIIKVPHRKDGKIFCVELLAASINNPGDLVAVKDPMASVNVDLTAHCIADPDLEQFGYVYMIDAS